MDVAVSEFRARLSEWLAHVKDGHEVVVTERGRPVARLVRAGSEPTIQRLIDEGVVARRAAAPRPKAVGAKRTRARRPVSDRISEDRR